MTASGEKIERKKKIFPLHVLDFVGAKWRLALTRPYALPCMFLGLVLFFFAISFMFSCARIAETYPITPRLDDTVLQ